MESILDYFIDPVLRGPTLGTMLMCLASSLVGVLTYLRKQSLLGESLSHAAYPGVILGVLIAGAWLPASEYEGGLTALLILLGAALGATGGLIAIQVMERRLGVRSDTALCFVLASFFGIGLTAASRMQITHTQLYRKIQLYLYGQAATMTDLHIYVYGALAGFILILVFVLYKELKVISFDRFYAKSLGVPTQLVEFLLFTLVVLAVVLGIRSVGVVLMSAMLIGPAVAARQYTNRLSTMLVLAGAFGLLSGFLGTYASVELSRALTSPGGRTVGIPTGPTIVMVSALLCVASLLLAPERGLFVRYYRIQRFKRRCLLENILKSIWREDAEASVTLSQLQRLQQTPILSIRKACRLLILHGWMERVGSGKYKLTPAGKRRAAHIVRLHRLWELYLADAIGIGVRRVHASAEEMEHVITPALERQLTELLEDPKVDPHLQPIPPPSVGERS